MLADIFNNLHSKYSKTNITKALEKLIEDELVFSKLYGKTSIYSVKQAPNEASSASDDLENISKSISDLNEKTEELVAENRKYDSSKLQLSPRCNLLSN